MSLAELRPPLGRTIQRIRKAAGVSQQELGEVLGIHQSAVSRVESGQQQLSPADLIALGEYFGLRIDDILEGVINYWAVTSKFQRRPPVPDRYRNWAHIRVREVLPLLLFLKERQGHSYVSTLLEKLKMDHFLLANPDQPIGVLFWLDLLEQCLNDKAISKEKLSDLLKFTRLDSVHGFLAPVYRAQTDPLALLQALILNATHYEDIYQLKVQALEPSSLVFSATPKSFMNDLRPQVDPSVLKFATSYNEGLIAEFPMYIGHKPVQLIERECVDQGFERCIYEARIA